MDNDPGEWVTTSAVLRRLADFDDTAAWNAFADRFRAPIERFAKGRGLSESDAEDVAQETLMDFARAFRDAGYDRGKGRLSSWLFGIAWRRIDHARRKAERRDAHEAGGFESQQHAGVEGPPAQSAEWQELWERSILEHCLRQVRKEFEPATFRAFEMLVLEHHAIEAAEAELAMTKNALAIAKHRVSTRLRELVQECDEVRP